jgi:hypothetical protein
MVAGMTRLDSMMTTMLGAALAFVLGYVLGTADHSGKDAMMEQYQSWSLQEQHDFVLAAISGKHGLRREIAEDWCAINRNTQRVCWNARMGRPVK